MSTHSENPTGTVRCKVSMGAKVVRGPSGVHGPEGQVEHLETQTQEYIEVDYEKAVGLFGVDKADELFGNEKE